MLYDVCFQPGTFAAVRLRLRNDRDEFSRAPCRVSTDLTANVNTSGRFCCFGARVLSGPHRRCLFRPGPIHHVMDSPFEIELSLHGTGVSSNPLTVKLWWMSLLWFSNPKHADGGSYTKNSRINPRTAGGGYPSPSGFSQITKKRRRVAPPNLS